MQIDVKATSPTIVGTLTCVSRAKKPQDIEITPSNEDITVNADEGFYIRSVIVKAIPSNGGNTEGGNNGDNDGTDSGNQG